MNPNLVSVIMPAYNGGRYIKQAIESVLTQTHLNWELIIVDDGSIDNTAQIIATVRDPRIIYVYQENHGQAAALNHGLDIASGVYITTLDVDDWFTPNSLEDRVVFLSNYLCYDVVYGNGIFCDKDGNPLKRFSELHTGEVVGDVFDTMLTNSFFGTGANVMMRTSALEKHDIRYDESIVWCQDYDLYLRLAEKCQFGYVDTITVWYRLHIANMTMSMPSDRRKKSLIRVKERALNSPRFAKTAVSQKAYFFIQFLLDDLDDWPSQMEIMGQPHFLSLPKHHRARVMRLLALKYLVARKYPKEVRKILRKSFALNPLNIKTFVVLILSYVNKGPFEWVFNIWRRVKLRNETISSPFDQISG